MNEEKIAKALLMFAVDRGHPKAMDYLVSLNLTQSTNLNPLSIESVDL